MNRDPWAGKSKEEILTAVRQERNVVVDRQGALVASKPLREPTADAQPPVLKLVLIQQD